MEVKDYKAQYYKNNKEKIRVKVKEYENSHKKEILLKKKKYYIENIERIRNYRITHRKQRHEWENGYIQERLSNDIVFKLKINLRSRLNSAINANYKTGSAVRDLGCSIPDFKTYIESKFYGNMTWDNWGDVWELDHIKELHTFDLTNREQFLKACHYTNLQPLSIADHKKKTFKNSR